MTLAWIAVLGSVAFALYTYVLYPLILRVLVGSEPGLAYEQFEDGDAWPRISITVPAYNEGGQIAATIEGLLALDYPEDRRQILVVSDASTDDTDRIVQRYADRGVELLRQPERRGKTAAEDLAARHLTGEIIVNTDASVRMPSDSLRRLIAPFRDPRIGLVSGRDVSIGASESRSNQGEAGYVGYEMWIRDLESRAGGIVGASGCYYAIRAELHRIALPQSLSRDFAAALNTHESGYRAVSKSDATCLVPRAGTLSHEFPRKVRTMTRGMETLLHKRSLLNPLRHGRFAFMLFSHKVCRWLVPWTALIGLLGLAALATEHAWAAALLVVAVGGTAVSAAVWAFGGRRRLPFVLSLPAFALMGNVAVLRASLLALAGDQTPIWEPTRRGASPPAGPH